MKKYFLLAALAGCITFASCGGKNDKNTGADTSSMSVDPSGGGDATGSGATGTTADTLGINKGDTSSGSTKGTTMPTDTSHK